MIRLQENGMSSMLIVWSDCAFWLLRWSEPIVVDVECLNHMGRFGFIHFKGNSGIVKLQVRVNGNKVNFCVMKKLHVISHNG